MLCSLRAGVSFHWLKSPTFKSTALGTTSDSRKSHIRFLALCNLGWLRSISFPTRIGTDLAAVRWANTRKDTTMNWRFVSVGTLLLLDLFLPAGGQSQTDSLVDCFPLSVGNQWVYAFNHGKVLDSGALRTTTTDSGTVSYRVLSRADFGDSILWAFRESRSLRHRVQANGVTTIDSLIADSTAFDMVELTTGRHQLYRRITDNGVLWTTVLPFMHDMTDTTQMYRYWRVDSSLTHVFVIRYPSPYPIVVYRFTVTRDSGMVSLAAFNAITFEGVELSDHHLAARTLTDVPYNPVSVLPGAVVLSQNFPNPFNPNTIIQYELPIATHVQLIVVNILGESVAYLVDQNMPEGKHQIAFDGHTLSSGPYFLILKTKESREVRKILLLR